MKTKIKKVIGLFAILGSSLFCKGDVSVYFAAHEDDWQLFMGRNVFNDMASAQWNPNDRVVIFHMTAGQGPWGNLNVMAAREKCAMNSVRFGANAGTFTGWQATNGIANVNGHPVAYTQYGNVVNNVNSGNITVYWFRLPDGCFYPNGSGCNNSGSLKWLAMGSGPVQAFDGSTTYANWNDLKNTVQTMLGWWNGWNNAYYPGTRLWVNHPDINAGINYNYQDHPDHWYTGLLAIQASVIYCPWNAAYIDYWSYTMPVNMSNDEIESESGLFGVCALGLTDNGEASTFEPGHKQWLDRNYFRIIDYCAPVDPGDDPVDGSDYTGPTETGRILAHHCGGDPGDDPLNPGDDPNTGGGRAGHPQSGDSQNGLLTDIPGQQKHVTPADISVFPNPAEGLLQISTKSGKEVIKVEILDLLGRAPLKTVFNSKSIDIADLKTGMYYAKIQTSTGHSSICKFYKR